MRHVSLLVLVTLAGCGGGATMPVSVFFSGSNAVPSVGAGFSAPVGTAVDNAGTLTLTALSGGNSLLVLLDSPALVANVPIAVGERHLEVDYTIGSGTAAPGWSSNSGSVTFTSLNPWVVTFNKIEMINGTPSAKGAFFISGTANFAH